METLETLLLLLVVLLTKAWEILLGLIIVGQFETVAIGYKTHRT